MLSRRFEAETGKQQLRPTAPEFVPRREVIETPEELILHRTTVVDGQESSTEDRDSSEPTEDLDLDQMGDLAAQTRTDPVLCQLIQHLKNRQKKTDKLTDHQQAELNFYTGLTGVRLHDGVVLRSSRGHQNPQVILPTELRQRALQLAHDDPLSGHGGVRRALHRVTANLFWYNVQRDVRRYCGSCAVCMRTKPKYTGCKAGRGTVPVEGKPFLQWSADILELAEDEEGHKHVLVMADQFSKWVEAFSLKRQTAEEVARCVVEVICRFGIMKSLLTDQGRNFESALLKGVCQLMGVKKLRTSIYHPCSNGQVERVNRSLGASDAICG